MEIIVGLIVVGLVGYFIFKPKKTEAVVETAPYKVDAPVAQESAPAVEPVKEVTTEASKPAKAKKPKAPAKPKAAKAPAKKAAAKPKKTASK